MILALSIHKIYRSSEEWDRKEWKFGKHVWVFKCCKGWVFFVKAVDLRTKVHPLYSLILLTGILMHRYFFLFFFKSQKVAMLSSDLSE